MTFQKNEYHCRVNFRAYSLPYHFFLGSSENNMVAINQTEELKKADELAKTSPLKAIDLYKSLLDRCTGKPF